MGQILAWTGVVVDHFIAEQNSQINRILTRLYRITDVDDVPNRNVIRIPFISVVSQHSVLITDRIVFAIGSPRVGAEGGLIARKS